MTGPGPSVTEQRLAAIEQRLSVIERHLQIDPLASPGRLQPGETRYTGGGESVHRHVEHGRCTCGQVIP